MKLTVPVKLLPGASVMGSFGPENENCEMEVVALEIVMLWRSSFVSVTVWGATIAALADVPDVVVPKAMAVGLTLTFACAAPANVNSMAAAAAMVLTLILFLVAIFIFFPSFRKPRPRCDFLGASDFDYRKRMSCVLKSSSGLLGD